MGPAFHPNVCTQIHTVGVGVAIGQSCMLLSAGTKGKRFMLPHATGAPACTHNTSLLGVQSMRGKTAGC